MPRASDHPTRRRTDQMVGGLLSIVGIAALAVAILALQHPKSNTATVAQQSTPSSSAAGPPTSTATPSPKTTQAKATQAKATQTKATPVSGSPSSSPSDVLGSEGHEVPIMVLNNTPKAGLAQTMRDQLIAGGWTVTSVGNMSDSIISTCAYFDPIDPKNLDAAQRLQTEFPAIKRVQPKFKGMPTGPVIVVLTTDYKG